MSSYGPRAIHSSAAATAGGASRLSSNLATANHAGAGDGYDVMNIPANRSTATAATSGWQPPPMSLQPQQHLMGPQQQHHSGTNFGLLGGRAASFQSTSSGINSFGPFNEERATLVIPPISLSSHVEPEKTSVVVSHIEPDGTLFLQNIKWAPALSDLMSKLNVEMSKSASKDLSLKSLNARSSSTPAKGIYCVAKSVNDAIWYRAKVIDVINAGVAVKFIDFGNDEILQHTRDVQPLKPYFTKLPAQAVGCRLHGMSTVFTEGVGEKILMEMLDQFLDTNLICQVVNKRDPNSDRLVVELFTLANGKPAHNVLDILQERFRPGSSLHHPGGGGGGAQRCASGLSLAANNKDGKVFSLLPFTQNKLDPNKNYNVVLVFCSSPGEFWCQLEEDAARLEQLMDYLQNLYSVNQLRPLASWPPAIFDAIAAQFADDDAWYRGVVQRVEDQKAEVMFVDYGNVAMLSEERCAQLPKGLANLPAMAFPCCLDKIKPLQGNRWGMEASQIIDTLTQQKGLVATVIELNSSNQYVVDLVQSNSASKDRNIAMELIAAKMVRPTNRHAGRDSRSRGLRGQSQPQPPPQESGAAPPPLNATVAASTSLTSATATTVTAGAAPASPDKRRNKEEKQPSPGEPFRRLNDLTGSVTNVMLSWVVNPSEFYVHLSESREDLENLAEKIEDIYTSLGLNEQLLPSVESSSCVTKFAEDDRWYRAEIIRLQTGKYLKPLEALVDVRFVDYGNADSVPRSHLKSAHPTMMKAPVFAVRCGLRGVACSDGAIPAGSQTFMDKLCGGTKVRCSFESRSRDADGEFRYQVDLTANGRDIAKAVLDAGYGVPDRAASEELVVVVAPPSAMETADDAEAPAAPAAAAPVASAASSATVELIASSVSVQKTVFDGLTSEEQRLQRDPVVSSPTSASRPVASQSASSSVVTNAAVLRPFLAFAGEKLAAVSHFNSLDSFFVHLVETENALHYLQSVLKTRYSNSTEVVLDPQVGQMVVAKWALDGSWYRARIESVAEDLVHVIFVDYGNADSVPNRDLRPLGTDTLLTEPPMSIHCRLWKPAAEEDWRPFGAVDDNPLTCQLDLRLKAEEREELDHETARDVHIHVQGRDLTKYFLAHQKKERQKQREQQPRPETEQHQPQSRLSASGDSSWLETSRLNVDAATFAPKNDSSVENVNAAAVVVVPAPALDSDIGAAPESTTRIAAAEPSPNVPAGEVSSVGSLAVVSADPPAAAPASIPAAIAVVAAASAHPAVADDARSVTSSTTASSKTTVKKFPKGEDLDGVTASLFLSWMDDPRCFYLCLCSRGDNLQHIESMLQEIYVPLQLHEKRLGNFQKGAACVAKYAADDTWYRAEIVSPEAAGDDDKCRVLFVDYGNREVVSKSLLKSLHPKVKDFSPIAIKCSFEDLRPPACSASFSSAVSSFVTSLVGDSELVCRFGPKVDAGDDGMDFYSVVSLEIKERNVDLRQLLIKEGFAAAAATNEAMGKEEETKEERRKEEEKNDGGTAVAAQKTPVSVVRGISPLPPTSAPTPLSEFVPPPPIISPASPTPNVPATPLVVAPPPTFSSVPAPEVTRQPRCAIPASPMPLQPKSAIMAHFESIDNFYVHLKDDEADLLQLVDRLFDFYESEEGSKMRLSSIEVGDVVCACWSDSNWYRALVLEARGVDDFRLLFLDYGNEDILSKTSLRVLAERWTSMPAKAWRCKMHKPENASWLTEASETIKAKLFETEAVFDLKFLSAAPTSTAPHDVAHPVTLTLQGDDLNLQLFKVESSSPKKAGGLEVPRVTEKPTSPNASTIYSAQDSASFSEKENQPSFTQVSATSAADVKEVTLTDSSLLHESGGKSQASLPPLERPSRDVTSTSETPTEPASSSSFLAPTPLPPPPPPTAPLPPCFQDENNNDDDGKKMKNEIVDVNHAAVIDDVHSQPVFVAAVVEDAVVMPPPPPTFADGSSSRPPSRPSSRRGSVSSSRGGSPPPSVRNENGRPRTPSQLKRSSRAGSLVEMTTQITAIVQATQAAAAVLKPRLPAASLPRDRVRVIIAHQEGLQKVWFQEESAEGQSLRMQEELQKIYAASTAPGVLPLPVSVGDHCVTKFAEDGQFYRAVIEEMKGDLAKVRYVDWGNTEEVGVSQLRCLSPAVASQPPLIFGPLSLLSSSSSSSLTPDAAAKFESLLETAPERAFDLRVEAGSEAGATPVAKLTTVEGGNDFLREYGLGRGDEGTEPDKNPAAAAAGSDSKPMKSYKAYNLPVGWQKSAYLTSSVSPTTFYVQFTGCEDDLDALMQEIASKIDDAPPLESPREGMPCLAKFSQDKSWYRSEVKRIEPDGRLTVQFVDYGNSEQATCDKNNVRDIAIGFLALPAQTTLCRVAGMTAKTGSWSAEAKRNFESMMVDGEVFLECESHTNPSRFSTAFPLIHDVYIGDAKGNANLSKKFLETGHAIVTPGSKLL